VHYKGCSTYLVRADFKAGYMHPRIDEVSVNSSVWRACSGFRKGVTSMFGWVHLRMVEAVWAPAVPRAIPRIEARRATVVV